MKPPIPFAEVGLVAKRNPWKRTKCSSEGKDQDRYKGEISFQEAPFVRMFGSLGGKGKEDQGSAIGLRRNRHHGGEDLQLG